MGGQVSSVCLLSSSLLLLPRLSCCTVCPLPPTRTHTTMPPHVCTSMPPPICLTFSSLHTLQCHLGCQDYLHPFSCLTCMALGGFPSHLCLSSNMCLSLMNISLHLYYSLIKNFIFIIIHHACVHLRQHVVGMNRSR